MMSKYVALAVVTLAVGSQAQGICGGICEIGGEQGLGPSGQPCYCDAECMDWDDCCLGYMELCQNGGDGGTVSADGQCKGDCFNREVQTDVMTGINCFCDGECQEYGDCCTGFEDACVQKPMTGTGFAEAHPDGRAAVEMIEKSMMIGAELVGDQCQGRCGATDPFTHPARNGGVCYCDQLCEIQEPTDCCPGYYNDCAFPILTEALRDAFDSSSQSQDAALCDLLKVTEGESCGCSDTHSLCGSPNIQNACANGSGSERSNDITPAGWFHWKCPMACGLCKI